MDEELEAAIDGAGRDLVFSRARAYGWRPGSDPPKHVWWGIVREINDLNKPGDRSNDPRPRLVVPVYHDCTEPTFLEKLFGIRL